MWLHAEAEWDEVAEVELDEAYESVLESHSTASFPWNWQTVLEGVEILQLNSVETGLETQNQLKKEKKVTI